MKKMQKLLNLINHKLKAIGKLKKITFRDIVRILIWVNISFSVRYIMIYKFGFDPNKYIDWLAIHVPAGLSARISYVLLEQPAGVLYMEGKAEGASGAAGCQVAGESQGGSGATGNQGARGNQGSVWGSGSGSEISEQERSQIIQRAILYVATRVERNMSLQQRSQIIEQASTYVIAHSGLDTQQALEAYNTTITRSLRPGQDIEQLRNGNPYIRLEPHRHDYRCREAFYTQLSTMNDARVAKFLKHCRS